jgi:hypothetical protein
VQVDPRLTALGFRALKLKSDELLSKSSCGTTARAALEFRSEAKLVVHAAVDMLRRYVAPDIDEPLR